MKKSLFFLPILFFSLLTFAGDNDSLDNEILKYAKFMDSVNSALKYETGQIKLNGSNIEMNVPAGFRFLNAEQSKFVVEDLWGNMPQGNLQGMLFPVNTTPFDDSSYAFIITYQEVGFVKDEDADKIDYDDLMKEIRKDEVEENKQRNAAGLQSLETVGWAAKPYYDKSNKVLHWALNLKAGGAENNTLNYKVIILGRKGMLSMNAVAPLYALDSVKSHINEVLAIPKFTEGNRYADFNPDVDNVAAWTIGGLVAGKILGKVGLLAFFGKFLKLIIVGAVALGAGIWKWITGRKKKEELVTVAEEQAPPVA